MGDLEIRATDVEFSDSPDVGNPQCLCSRCEKPILTGFAIRYFNLEQKTEYRFHPACLGFSFSGLEDE